MKYLYDTLLQWVTSPWAEYLRKYAAQGRLVRDVFFNDVYQYAGIILFSICILSCLLYYFYFNRKFGKYYAKRTWFKWMFITSIIIGILTFFVGRAFVGSFICPTTHLIVWLSIINIVYGLIVFFIVSLLCQLIAIVLRKSFSYDLSPMASRTPF